MINKNTCPYDTKEALEIATEYLSPVKSYLSEITCSGNYILEDISGIKGFTSNVTDKGNKPITPIIKMETM